MQCAFCQGRPEANLFSPATEEKRSKQGGGCTGTRQRDDEGGPAPVRTSLQSPAGSSPPLA
ncbi:hypothetical protein SEVIR_9G067150v4 [Setaria viridis]